MRCLIIDDDENFSKAVIERVEDEIPELAGSFDLILTEKALRERLKSKSEFDYDVIILDVMVRWTDFSTPDPEEEGGYFRAGIRCLGEIRKLKNGPDIPVLIHSAVDPGD